MPMGIPPKKKRPKSNWMKGFQVAEPLTESEIYFKRLAAKKRFAFYQSTKSRRARNV